MTTTFQFGDNSKDNNTLIIDTNTANFSKDVLEASRKQLILVDFWAPWCGPCKQLTPILEKTIMEAKGAVKLVKMNIEDHPTIAGQLGIQSIPAVIAFIDGKPVDGFMGLQTAEDIKKFIAKLTLGEEQAALIDALQLAKTHKDMGETQQASEIYSQILQHFPENITAIANLADIMHFEGHIENAKNLLNTAPDNKKNDPLLRGVLAKISLLEQTEKLGTEKLSDERHFLQRIEKDPKDYQAYFDLALLYNAQNLKNEAANYLLAIIKIDKEWQNEAARKQLLQFFEAWGPMDSASISARRQLSSLLFA